MSETPREYKKRIDEKWKRNERNKEKLLKKIEGYELLDERFKEQTQKEILANFEKNEKAELEGEQYTTIVAELGKIDKKYEELEEMKRELEVKNVEKDKIEKEIKGSKLTGVDETTLNLQMANARKLKERFEILRVEIDELENDIKNREQEIKEIEESYGEMVESNSENIHENDEETENQDEKVSGQSETLKEVHEQTIKELWKKDKTRKDIIKILDDGTGIDDILSKKIKKEISDKFFGYYDEKQSSLSIQSARYLKNMLKNRNKDYELIKAMPEGEDKIERLKKFERLEKAYDGITRREQELSQMNNETIVHIEDVGIIGGKPCVKAKMSNGSFTVIRGDEEYHGFTGFAEIGEIKEIGGKPCFKVRFSGKGTMWNVVRWNVICGSKNYSDFYKIGDIKEIGGKPCFKAKVGKHGSWVVVRGYDTCGSSYDIFDKVGEIKDIGGEPCFKAKDCDTVYHIVGYKTIKSRTSVKGAALEVLDFFADNF